MNFLAISSEIATTILAMVILGIDLLMPKEKSRKCLGYITVIGLVGVFIAIFNRSCSYLLSISNAKRSKYSTFVNATV